MGTVYARGRKLWVAFEDAAYQRQWKPTRFFLGQEVLAEAFLAELEAQVDVQRRFGATDDGPVTVANFGKRWLAQREGLPSHKSEEGRLRLHVYPAIGDMRIDEIRPRHLVELVRGLREAGELSSRSILHVYGSLRVLFRDALIEELIVASPAILTKAQLPRKEDRDPEWRAKAIYTRDEVEALISHDAITQDRQLLYALAALAGLRFGEIAALRWRHYDAEAKPLGRLLVANSNLRRGTKTGVTREVPAHRTLAKMIGAWKLAGWAKEFGRQPRPEDYIVPSRGTAAFGTSTQRSKSSTVTSKTSDGSLGASTTSSGPW